MAQAEGELEEFKREGWTFVNFVLVRRLLTAALSSFRNHTDYFWCLPICFPMTPTPNLTNTNKSEQNSRGIDLLIIDHSIRHLEILQTSAKFLGLAHWESENTYTLQQVHGCPKDCVLTVMTFSFPQVSAEFLQHVLSGLGLHQSSTIAFTKILSVSYLSNWVVESLCCRVLSLSSSGNDSL